jgi:heat shock protein HtpX
MDNLFSTHPNTENRIAALHELARYGGGGASPMTPSSGPSSDFASTGRSFAANPGRKSRSVPNTGRGGSQPPKGPWS